jgi:hypothetical protein
VQSRPPRSANQPAIETETLDTPWQASPRAMPTKSSVSASEMRQSPFWTPIRGPDCTPFNTERAAPAESDAAALPGQDQAVRQRPTKSCQGDDPEAARRRLSVAALLPPKIVSTEG